MKQLLPPLGLWSASALWITFYKASIKRLGCIPTKRRPGQTDAGYELVLMKQLDTIELDEAFMEGMT